MKPTSLQLIKKNNNMKRINSRFYVPQTINFDLFNNTISHD